MIEIHLYHWLLWIVLGLGLLTGGVLLAISAPYGRHGRRGWGPTVSATVGWVTMEAAAPLVFSTCWLFGAASFRLSAVGISYLVIWNIHYVYRAFVYPFRRRGGSSRMPVLIAGLGLVFNSVNGYLNGRWVFRFGPVRSTGWFADPRFICGLMLFVGGFVLNRHSDEILRRLRAPGEVGYKVPFGGAFRWVSSPNYLGEIIQWCGWALLTWSGAGLVFAIWTAANLWPRSVHHHRWYTTKFADYPANRNALIPFVGRSK
jgi:3-oxo-5-alpha-steroid 4-dehydrogenase 1